jgi:hypothetical protein
MKYKNEKNDTREYKPQGNFLGACYNARKDEKEKRKITQLVWKLLKCCMDGFEHHIPLFLVRTYKNQQTNACWKCCTTQQS